MIFNLTLRGIKMTVTIDQNYIDQFSAGIHSLLEQETAKFKGIFMEEHSSGEKHFFERLGSFTASEVVGRLQTTDLQDPAHSRRMATVKLYEASTYLDDLDKIKLLIDPASEYSIKLARAHGRNFDDVVIGALLNVAATGKSGSGTANLAAGNKITAGGTGMTVTKFNQGLKILEAFEVDVDSGKLMLAVGADGVQDLLSDSSNQFTSFDFQEGKVLATGNMPMFRGVKILRTQRVPDNGSDKRAILFSDEAAKVAIGKDLQVKTAERPDLNFAQQISTYMAIGAVRMEENHVVEISYTV